MLGQKHISRRVREDDKVRSNDLRSAQELSETSYSSVICSFGSLINLLIEPLRTLDSFGGRLFEKH